MSIGDYGPLLKKAAARQKSRASAKQTNFSGQRSYNAMPVSFSIGKRNYKASDVTSAAGLGRALKPVLDDIARDFRDYTRMVKGFIGEDLKNALVPTLELSLVYVPKATGDLANSAYLEVAPFRNGARVEMGYGRGGIPDYAIYVHEIPYKHAEPTTWKFLERALNEDWHNVVQRVTDNVRIRTGL